MTSPSSSTDILIWGATPAGVMAAVAAAREGRQVIIADCARHVGGMTASGLGKSDVQNREAIRGLFFEFTRRVRSYYETTYGKESDALRLSNDGYYYEPAVAERIFGEMIDESKMIGLQLGRLIERVDYSSSWSVVLGARHGDDRIEVQASLLVDASYEGDLYAAAGAEYRVGREGRDDYGEPHAGRIFLDYENFILLEGSTGRGDDRLQAYTYRLCLTDDPDNSAPLDGPPEGYDRNRYLNYLEDLKAGRLGPPKNFREGHGYFPPHYDTIMRAFSFTPIPNRKYDVNINPRPIGFPFPEENLGYAEACWDDREAISRRLRALTLGLLYFAQNDPAVPAEQRELARRYHLPKDEFVDDGHFPWQLYVREARRLRGLYTISELDVSLAEGSGRTKIHPDSVATGEFPIDSFPVSKEPSKGNEVLEGYVGVLHEATNPYQIPFRALLPASIDRMIVPVAASATHIAFSTLRMEPLWMALGQVAGIAAGLSLESGVCPRELPADVLQRRLLEADAVIAYFEDLDPIHPFYHAIQFWATRGFFSSYRARPDDPITRGLLDRWLARAADLASMTLRPIDIADSLSAIKERGEDRVVTRFELEEMTSKLFPDRPARGRLASDRCGEEPVTRGEVCALLYEICTPPSRQ